jgi:hypothetical protein
MLNVAGHRAGVCKNDPCEPAKGVRLMCSACCKESEHIVKARRERSARDNVKVNAKWKSDWDC